MQNSSQAENKDDVTFYLVGVRACRGFGDLVGNSCGVTAEGSALALMVVEAAVDSGLHHSLAFGLWAAHLSLNFLLQ